MANNNPISNIVQVSIDIQDQTVTQEGFGIPLIVGDNATGWGSQRVRTYNSFAAVEADFDSGDGEYKAAQAMFDQQPLLPEIKIGQQIATVAQIETLVLSGDLHDGVQQQQTIVFSANIVTGNSIAFSVNSHSITQAFDTSNSTTLSDLATQIAAISGIASAISDGSHTITVTSSVEGVSIPITTPSVTGGASQATAVVSQTVTPINVGNISLQLDGVNISQNFTTNQLTTMNALVTQLTTGTNIGTAILSNSNHTVTMTAAVPGIGFDINSLVISAGTITPTGVLTITTPNHGIAEDLAEITEQDPDWYGLITIDRTLGAVLEASAWTEANQRIFGTCSSNVSCYDPESTTDIAAKLFALKYNRTYGFFNGNTDNFLDGAIMAQMFTYNPGQATWDLKSCAGIIADSLTFSQQTALSNKNFNYYVTIGGNDLTQTGVMASGRFIDIQIGADWLVAQIASNIFSLLISVPKVPYTDPGIALIENQVLAALALATTAQFNVLAANPAPTCTVPKVANIAPSVRATRRITGITFGGQLQGAIQDAVVQGTVTV